MANNIFISHHGKDDAAVQDLKKRLERKGYDVLNGSIDSTKYQEKRPSDAVVGQMLRDRVSWASTFICLIGNETHSRPWVNDEIAMAQNQGKTIVGVYMHGCKDNVPLPENLEKYGRGLLGWNSIDKLGDIIQGRHILPECPDGSQRNVPYQITRIRC